MSAELRTCPAGHPCRREAAGECRFSLPAGGCVLAQAAAGEHSLDELAELLGVSRALAGEILKQALRKLRRAGDVALLAEFLDRTSGTRSGQ